MPKPRARLLRTWLKWPRPIRMFAPRLSTEDALAHLPDLAEVAHWGEAILFEDFIIALHRDGTTSWLTHVLTMPYGNENLAEWDEVRQPYDERKTRLSLRKAVVHVPGGREYKATSEFVPLNAHQREMKLTFAPLRPGVVIEFESQDDQFVPDEVGPAIWSKFPLCTFVPCRLRRFTAAIAEPFSVNIQPHHCDVQPQESWQDGYRVYRWQVNDVPGVELDNWTPPLSEFTPWIDLSSLPNWSSIASHYCQELVPNGQTPDAVKELAHSLADQATNEREKALAIYRYTTRDVRYGRHPSELEAPKTRDASKVLEELRGDCKDKSSLLVSLLNEIGVSAKVAVLLTAVNGRTPLLPSRRFDHAIVRAVIDGQEMWLDPAAGPFGFGDIPLNDQGVKALILEDGSSQIVDIPDDPPERQSVRRVCSGKLDANGEYCFRAQITARGEKAAIDRFALLDRNDDHRRRTVQQSVGEERPGAIVDGVEFGDVEDLSGPMTYAYTVRLPGWARRVQDLLLFRIPWAETAEITGPISAPERRYPLQVPGTSQLHETHEITLPAGFHGYGLPYEFKYESPWVKFSLQVTCTEEKLFCQRRMEIQSGIVPTEKFTEFKHFWEQCARADTTDVVLVRGEEHRT